MLHTPPRWPPGRDGCKPRGEARTRVHERGTKPTGRYWRDLISQQQRPDSVHSASYVKPASEPSLIAAMAKKQLRLGNRRDREAPSSKHQI